MYIEQVLLFYCTSRRKKGPAKRAIHLIFQLVYTVAMILATRMYSMCNVVFFLLYSTIKPKNFYFNI